MSTTPLVNLVLPDVSSTPGPTWATMLNTAFGLLDSHDHTPGKGSLIPTAGLNINADLELNGFNLTEVLAAVFNSQAGTLGPTLTNRFYVVGNEAYFNDGVGNAVKLTNAGAVNVSGSNGIGGDYGGGNPAALNFVEATSFYEFYENPAGSSRGNIKFGALDMNSRFSAQNNALAGNLTITDTDNTFIIIVDTSAGRTITLPNPASGYRMFIIKDKTGSSQTNPITLARFGAEQIDGTAASKSLSKNFGTWIVISDLTNWWVLKDDSVFPVEAGTSAVFVDTGNGTGSTNTRVRRFVNTRQSVGAAITYADSATNGGSFTINANGIYSITYCETDTGGAGGITAAGITVNGSALTTNILSITYAQGRRAHFPIDTGVNSGGTSITLRLSSGDVVRAQTDNTGGGGGEGAATIFSITQIVTT